MYEYRAWYSPGIAAASIHKSLSLYMNLASLSTR